MTRIAIDNLGTTEPSTSPVPRRFSPVLDTDGGRVPVLYAGENLKCALGETVFHDVDDDPAAPAVIFRADLLTLRAGAFRLARDTALVDLTDTALDSLGVTRGDVVVTPEHEYSVTRTWAQTAWEGTTAAGLIWNSRRSRSGGLAFMLFVDPARPADKHRAVSRRADLIVDSPPLPLYDGDGLGAVLTAASARNVTVVF